MQPPGGGYPHPYGRPPYPPPHHHPAYGPPQTYMMPQGGYPPHMRPLPPPPYMPGGMRPAPPLGAYPLRGGGPPPLNLPRGLPALQAEKPPEESPMKVFVGKLPSDAPDSFIYSLLDQCGKIAEWNRAIDPNTNRPKNFGFCTYALPTGARRALKLLNGFKVDYQEIIIKIGKKEQEALENMELPDESERDEQVAQKLNYLIRERNIGAAKREREDGTEEGGSMEDTEEQNRVPKDAEHVEERKKDPSIMSEIEKFRQAQAERDRKKEEERVKEIKRKVEEQERAERMKAERNEREAKARARKEEALAAVQARGRSPESDDESDGGREKRRRRSKSHSAADRHRKSSKKNREEDLSASTSAEKLIKTALEEGGGEGEEEENGYTGALEQQPPPPATLSAELSGEILGGSRKLGLSFSSKGKKSGKGGGSIFQSGEDEEENGAKIVRPLIPIDYDDEEKGKASSQSTKSKRSAATAGGASSPSAAAASTTSGDTAAAKASKPPGLILSDKQKKLVAQIPKETDALYAYPIDWASVEKYDLIRIKMKDWVIKKIKDLLGEEEKTLIDFICTKLSHRCTPKDLLKELRLVLEDDADLFVQKLWRIMIYYIIETRDR